MIPISALPTLNAILNGAAAVLLLVGHGFIKRGKKGAHRRTMIGVFVLSTLFLISYLTYHAAHGSQPFQGQGWIRPVYFSILLTHTVLAAAIVPLAVITLVRGLRKRYEMHKKIARWTYPIWLYVSITGVIIYLMLYQLFPAPEAVPTVPSLLSSTL